MAGVKDPDCTALFQSGNPATTPNYVRVKGPDVPTFEIFLSNINCTLQEQRLDKTPFHVIIPLNGGVAEDQRFNIVLVPCPGGIKA